MKGRKIKQMLLKVLVGVVIFIIVLTVVALVFMRAYPEFGARPNKADKKNYAERAQGYYDGKVFSYPSEWLKDSMTTNDQVSTKERIPRENLPVFEPDFSKATAQDVTITWLGHSSSLIQMHGKNILVDPVFRERSSPVQWAGPERFTEPSVTINDLPQIDAVLITHDHYDHLDMETIKQLESRTLHFIVPLGVEKHIQRWIHDDSKVIHLAWWENYELDGLEIYCTPANHRSGRAIDNQMTTLTCSWVLKDEYHQILESSDTGYGGHFEEIHNRFGDFDLFMPDCGQYSTNWPRLHMFPEESAEASVTLGAKAVMPIHWGAFTLSTNGWDDSVERLTTLLDEKGIEVVTPKICETMSLNDSENYHERWWREYE